MGKGARKEEGDKVGGCCGSSRERLQELKPGSSVTDMDRSRAICDVILEAESTKLADTHKGQEREKHQGNSQHLAWAARCRRLRERTGAGRVPCELHCGAAAALRVTLGRDSNS